MKPSIERRLTKLSKPFRECNWARWKSRPKRGSQNGRLASLPGRLGKLKRGPQIPGIHSLPFIVRIARGLWLQLCKNASFSVLFCLLFAPFWLSSELEFDALFPARSNVSYYTLSSEKVRISISAFSTLLSRLQKRLFPFCIFGKGPSCNLESL